MWQMVFFAKAHCWEGKVYNKPGSCLVQGPQPPECEDHHEQEWCSAEQKLHDAPGPLRIKVAKSLLIDLSDPMAFLSPLSPIVLA